MQHAPERGDPWRTAPHHLMKNPPVNDERPSATTSTPTVWTRQVKATNSKPTTATMPPTATPPTVQTDRSIVTRRVRVGRAVLTARQTRTLPHRGAAADRGRPWHTLITRCGPGLITGAS